MVKSPTKPLTLEEFLKLSETKPSLEYINGQIIQKPMPQGKHSILQGELVSNINSVTKPQRIALAFPELRCTFGGRSIVPDIAVFAWERILLDERGEVANVFKTYPDWTIEILSPDQSQTKVTGNILHCLKHGSCFGWLIDPDEHSVLVYPPKQQPELLQEEQEILPVPDLVSDFQLTVGQLFGWLKL
ncbi:MULTISPECIES: Uma2 family endonuclease [unclassified Nostoc]|uniref:Uma2 family endonuclease n=1 Tax=unclassified Nostoc TaxID=2593658 RepID=UPI0025AABA07|nr:MULTISPECIES: Uma2 family endonuclease [unclassified Nostoc]MDM9581922.1 Uma2 family endonuclease [Nostoc sp. GT001]MDZ7945376.1 Uma2 family endonuclease [Nostoc sp. EfeVER01]MDZ7993413.1 Uma2 family endonuclease [Nostoc sp. EspVER01]